VILASDPNWAPKPFRALYFGEFGNNAQEVLSASDRDRIRLAGATRGESLLVSVLPMPFSTTAQRSEIRNQLVWAYNPVWQVNAIPPASSELTRKLESSKKSMRSRPHNCVCSSQVSTGSSNRCQSRPLAALAFCRSQLRRFERATGSGS
jgi:hypothetical protein